MVKSSSTRSHEHPTSVGGRNQLLSMQNPALQSQAASQNWGFHTQFPPTLARNITGAPLTTRGKGLYMSAGRGLYM